MTAFAMSHTNSAGTELDLNDGNVYQVLEPGPSGIYHAPYENVLVETPASRPRSVLTVSNVLSRVITIPLLIHGGSRSTLIANVTALMKHFAVDGRDSKLGTWTFTADNNVERAIAVAPLAIAQDAMAWLRSNPSARGWATTILSLEAPDPFFYDPTAVEPSGALSGTSAVNISCANAGDVDAWIAQITITNQATNLKITDAYGNWLQFNDTVDAGETLTLKLNPLHSDTFSMTHSVDGDWSGKRVSGSVIPVVKYGTNNLTFQGGDAADDATIAIKFYSTYSRHGE